MMHIDPKFCIYCGRNLAVSLAKCPRCPTTDPRWYCAIGDCTEAVPGPHSLCRAHSWASVDWGLFPQAPLVVEHE